MGAETGAVTVELSFEWDPAKAETNIAKHGVPFEVAIEVFSDPAAIFEDDPYSVHEYREFAIGRSQTGLLLVVFTERRERVVRIISARLANPHERRKYRQIR